MRRRVFGLVVAALAVTLVTTTEATEKRKSERPGLPPEIGSVTDAQGNTVPLRHNAVPGPEQAEPRPAQPDVQRGQDWWPYASAVPPYTFVGKRAESMAESEIQVNGVAMIDVRDVEAAIRLVPADLKLDAGAPARAARRLLPRQDRRVRARTQEQVDALTIARAPSSAST